MTIVVPWAYRLALPTGQELVGTVQAECYGQAVKAAWASIYEQHDVSCLLPEEAALCVELAEATRRHEEGNTACQCLECTADRAFLERHRKHYAHYMQHFHPAFLAALQEEQAATRQAREMIYGFRSIERGDDSD